MVVYKEKREREKVDIKRIIKPTENCGENKAKPWEQQVPEWGEEETVSQLSGRPALPCGSSPFPPPSGATCVGIGHSTQLWRPGPESQRLLYSAEMGFFFSFLPFFLFCSCFGLFSRQLP